MKDQIVSFQSCLIGGRGGGRGRFWLRPFTALSHPFRDTRRWLSEENVEHHGRGDGQTVPYSVDKTSVVHAQAGWRGEGGRETNQVTMYCRWLLRILTSAARPMGFPAASAFRASIMSGTATG